MIKLRFDNKEDDNYINSIGIDHQNKTMSIKYASGRKEEQEFDIDNYNFLLSKMEDQYYDNVSTFLHTLKKTLIGQWFSLILTTMTTVISVSLFTYDPLRATAFNYICAAIVLFTQFAFAPGVISNIQNIKEIKEKVSIIQAYIANKEDFKILVEDYKTKEMKEWYLINLTNIDVVNSVEELYDYAEAITQENVEKYKDDFTQVLKLKHKK